MSVPRVRNAARGDPALGRLGIDTQLSGQVLRREPAAKQRVAKSLVRHPTSET